MHTAHEIWLIFRWAMQQPLRNQRGWSISLVQPVLYLVLSSTAFVGFALIAEFRSSVIERMRVTPVSRAALVLGCSLCDVVVLTVQSALLIALVVPFGLHTPSAVHAEPGSGRGARLGDELGVLQAGAETQERGRVRTGIELDHRAVTAAVRHSAADVAGVGPGTSLAPSTGRTPDHSAHRK